MLLKSDEAPCTTPESINKKTKHIISSYQSLINKYMPLRKLSNKEKKSLQKPWITPGIRKSIAVRDKLLRKSTRDKSEETYDKYKFYRNLITRLKKQSFNNYYKDKFNQNSKDRKKAWETVNEITNHKIRKKTEIRSMKGKNGEDLRDTSDIANCLNDHFNSIGRKMASEIEEVNGNTVQNGIEPPENSIYLFKTNFDEIIKLIQGLKPNKAPGIDGISNYIIKVSAIIVAPTLIELYNCCMNIGSFPDMLKTTCIIPLHKGGDQRDPSNYRPISLLPQFGKLFEKVIKKRFIKFFDKYNLITPHQFGFRKKYSTELAVTDIHDMLLKNVDEKKVSCTIFLDLAKAFDSVDHKILLNKLERHGIRGRALSLMSSYLSNRQHLVKIQNSDSTFLTLETGVPQGSVLGPLLFLIFINDLPHNTNFTVKLFADDTSLSLDSDNYYDLQKNVNNEILKVYQWLCKNKLTLNIKKSKFMIVSNKRSPADLNFQVKVKNINLEKCSSYKYLGVHIDENLKWKTHIDYICEKVSKVCGMFAKLRHCIDFDMLKIVYHALVASHLQYCNLAWGNADEEVLKPLQVLQNRIIRIMTFAPFSCHNVKHLYDDLELLDLHQTHKLSKAKFVYKHKNGILPNICNKYFNIVENENGRNLRSLANSRYRQVWGRTTRSLKRMQYDGVKIWNSIPDSIRNVKSLGNFSQIYKIHLLNG